MSIRGVAREEGVQAGPDPTFKKILHEFQISIIVNIPVSIQKVMKLDSIPHKFPLATQICIIVIISTSTLHLALLKLH
jgi:hypothetical protein